MNKDNSHDFHEAIKKSISQMASSFSDAEIQTLVFALVLSVLPKRTIIKHKIIHVS
jgi:hypothetical protein